MSRFRSFKATVPEGSGPGDVITVDVPPAEPKKDSKYSTLHEAFVQKMLHRPPRGLSIPGPEAHRLHHRPRALCRGETRNGGFEASAGGNGAGQSKRKQRRGRLI